MEDITIPEKQALALWRRDLEAWGMRILRHYGGWISGLALSAVGFAVNLRETGDYVWTWWGLFFAGFMYSAFQGWRDERRERESNDRRADKIQLEKDAEIIRIKSLLNEKPLSRTEIRESLKTFKHDGTALLDWWCEAKDLSPMEKTRQWILDLERFSRKNLLPPEYDEIFSHFLEVADTAGYGLKFVQNPITKDQYEYLMNNVLRLIQGIKTLASKIT